MKKHLYILFIFLFPLFVNSQNVGIGTLTPDFKLDIESYVDARVRIYSPNNSYAGFLFDNDLQQYFMGVDSVGLGSNFRVYDNTADALRFQISTNGNVGIGALNPEALLHLYSTNTNGAGSRLIFGNDLLSGRTNAYVAEWGWQTNTDSDILELSGFNGIKFTTGSSSANTPMEITSSGDIAVTGKISGVTDPESAQDASTKAYVDNAILTFGIALGIPGIEGLLNSGFSIQQLIDAGVSVQDLYEAGASVQDLIDLGVSVEDLLDAGVTVQELMDAGVTIQELYDAGALVEDLLNAGVTVQELLDAGVTIQELYDAGALIQDLLDAGVTIQELLNVGASPSEFIGLNFGGGIIFYMAGDGTGLISAPSDQSTGTDWGCNAISISGADGTAIGTGGQNTIDILNGCSEIGIAARVCDDFVLGIYDDWFLPSSDELNEMYLKIGPGASGTNQNIGGFASEFYWSSTETDPNFALTLFFSDGFQYWVSKAVDSRVRAIRTF